MRFILPFLLVAQFAFSQKKTEMPFFLNEYNISVNHSIYNLKYNTFGVGVGGYRTINVKKHLALSFGLEYNFSKQIHGYKFNGGHSYPINSNDFYLSLNTISAPFYTRFQFGEKIKFFVDPGFFVESIIWVRRVKDVIQNPNEPEPFIFRTGETVPTINFGGSLGLGLSFPLEKIEYYIKPELKFGIINNRYLRICFGVKFK